MPHLLFIGERKRFFNERVMKLKKKSKKEKQKKNKKKKKKKLLNFATQSWRMTHHNQCLSSFVVDFTKTNYYREQLGSV